MFFKKDDSLDNIFINEIKSNIKNDSNVVNKKIIESQIKVYQDIVTQTEDSLYNLVKTNKLFRNLILYCLVKPSYVDIKIISETNLLKVGDFYNNRFKEIGWSARFWIDKTNFKDGKKFLTISTHPHHLITKDGKNDMGYGDVVFRLFFIPEEGRSKLINILLSLQTPEIAISYFINHPDLKWFFNQMKSSEACIDFLLNYKPKN